jgi:thiol-disulfide isomerase/thioredoxin
MTNIPTSLVVASVLGITTIAGSAFAPAPDTISPPNTRHPAPALALKDAGGATVRLADYKGRVVLLDFWATWCTGCKLEMPWFMEFEKQYRVAGLSAVGVAVDEEGWRTLKPYLAEHPITYPVVLGNFDTVEKVFKLPASLPQTLLLDRNGRIAATHSGVVNKENFEKDVKQLLDERGQ